METYQRLYKNQSFRKYVEVTVRLISVHTRLFTLLMVVSYSDMSKRFTVENDGATATFTRASQANRCLCRIDSSNRT